MLYITTMNHHISLYHVYKVHSSVDRHQSSVYERIGDSELLMDDFSLYQVGHKDFGHN